MLTARALNRATLGRQLLLERERVGVVDAVRRVVAIQAQSPASPYIALWNRIAGFDPADLDAAYASHDVVKASLVRLTLHAVVAADYPPFHHALVSSLRASRLHDRRFEESGLSIEEVDALLPEVLAFTASPRANAEVEAWLEARFGRPVPRAWWAYRTFAPVVHAVTGAAWSHGTRPSYVTSPIAPLAGDTAASEQILLRRYLEGFGPATAQDFGQFSILRQPVVRAAIDALGDALVVLEGPGGARYYDVPGGLLPDEGAPSPPRLMAMWDSCLLAYADRGRILPEPYRKVVIRRNGDVLPTVLVDGYVAGVWRPGDGGGVEITAFQKLSAATWKALAAEAAALVAFLSERDPDVYRRHRNWWDTEMPAVQVRSLP